MLLRHGVRPSRTEWLHRQPSFREFAVLPSCPSAMLVFTSNYNLGPPRESGTTGRFHGIDVLVHSAAATDRTHPRIEALFDTWAHRLDAATVELGLAEFVA
jgi:hypothetical protein